RGQAQGMLVFFTQGIGMLIGYLVADARFKTTVTDYKPLVDEIKSHTPESNLTFAEQFGRMFAMNRPAGVDQQLFTSTMEQWKEFWILPAIMAGVILLIFA